VALRRVGIESLVIERVASIREVGAGLSSWWNAVNALRQLGLEDRVMASASVVERSVTRTPAGRFIAENAFGAISHRQVRLVSASTAQFCKKSCSIRCRQILSDPVRAAPVSRIRPPSWRAANALRPIFLWEQTGFRP